MNKILKVINFGVYYKTAEKQLISGISDQDKAHILETYSNYLETGRIIKHQEDYLIAPIQLEIKLTQNDPEMALQARKSLLQLFVQLDQFCITVHKGQYDNVQMLLDLTSDYMRFLGEESLRQRKKNLEDMNYLLEQSGMEVSKIQARELYMTMFRPMLEIVVSADPKKPEKMIEKLAQTLAQSGQEELYRAIVLGMNSDELMVWAKEIVQEKANAVKREQQIKKEKKSKGFMSRFFGGKEEEKTEEQKRQDLEKIEREIQDHANKLTSISGNSAERANIPDITFAFTLDQSNLTLVNNMQEYKGVTLQTREFKIGVNMYDVTNKYNKKSMDVNLSLMDYSLWVNYMDEVAGYVDYSPFMKKLDKDQAKPAQPGASMVVGKRQATEEAAA